MRKGIFLRIILFIIVAIVLVAVFISCQLGNTSDIRKARIRNIKVADIEIAYKTIGKGYPLVMIMGYSGTMDIWSPQVVNELAKYYKVIVFDNRGMGKSTDSGQEFSIELFADDAAYLLDALKVKKAHILAWSMGTNIALDLILEYPDKVNKLILYAADCGGNENIWPDPEVMKKIGNNLDKPQERAAEMLKILFPADWLKAHPDPRKYFPIPKETSSMQNIQRQFGAMEKWVGAYSRLAEIKCPVLLITGTNDILTPPKNSFIIAEKITGSRIEQFKDAGHGLMYQYPDRFSRVILTFLADSVEAKDIKN